MVSYLVQNHLKNSVLDLWFQVLFHDLKCRLVKNTKFSPFCQGKQAVKWPGFHIFGRMFRFFPFFPILIPRLYNPPDTAAPISCHNYNLSSRKNRPPFGGRLVFISEDSPFPWLPGLRCSRRSWPPPERQRRLRQRSRSWSALPAGADRCQRWER